ncbi:MAG: hypothetical protein M3N43_06700 [Actinomycetota bacterium]|nr:hypothetical protein [Actinomycetota bacterium]
MAPALGIGALGFGHASTRIGDREGQAVPAALKHQADLVCLGVTRSVDKELSPDTQQQCVVASSGLVVQNDLGPKAPSSAFRLSHGCERHSQTDVLENSRMQVKDLAPQLINRVVEGAQGPMVSARG